MHAIWDPSRFPGVIDYQTWEHALLDDENITRCVQAGELVRVIDWRTEPGALDDRGEPTSGALPDFVVLITPEDATGSGNRYRTRVKTFDRA